MTSPLRALPSADRLLQDEKTALLIETFGRAAVLEAVRAVLDETRSALLHNGATTSPDAPQLVTAVGDRLEGQFRLSLRPVINATGVVLHTNLGRAPLSKAAIAAAAAVGSGYSNLEFDLATGKRGKRGDHIETLVAEVLGAEAALVVNNSAAAVLMMLSVLAAGRGVIISRGQLVEIGGGFRMPDVMVQSGVKLVEVGTTNRTRLEDYARAINEESAALLRVHHSNYTILGFTEETPLADLAALAHERGLLCLDDLGSGAFLDTAQFGLGHEPTIGESLAAGADVIVFSGDKLLGGPQAGIIVGKQAPLDRLKTHPLARALRVGKLTLAALAATLNHYRRGQALTHIPIWQMIAKPPEELEAAAKVWAEAIQGELIAGESTIGGGSLPGETLPTILFAPKVESAQAAQTSLRQFDPPIIARVKEDRLLLDPRTVLEEQIETVAAALHRL